MAVTKEGLIGTYTFDNAWEQAQQRLARLGETLDPITIRRIQAIGVSKGWRCLDVGAGGGSIAKWLCATVGSAGAVVATDIDTRFLDTLAESNLKVQHHNVVSDELPRDTYDFIHARLLLMHLPERETILAHLVTALKTGGWLLLEEHDAFSVLALASGSYVRVFKALIEASKPNGMVTDWARRLPTLLSQHGLLSVAADVDVPMFNGTSANAQLWSLTFSQPRERILAAGASADDFDATLKLLNDPDQWFVGPALIGAWGRRSP